MKLPGARAEGAVEITVHPDNWMPKDKRKIECEFRIEAQAKGDKVAGRYKRRTGKTQVTAEVSGTLGAGKGRMLAGEVELRVENALDSGTAWLRRANVTLEVAHGKTEKGTIGCADPFRWRVASLGCGFGPAPRADHDALDRRPTWRYTLN